MTIYVSHASAFDYESELYKPIEKSEVGAMHTFIFPHRDISVLTNSRTAIESADLVIAEVSHPSTGQGIELGWASANWKRIVCIYRSDFKPSPAIKVVTPHFIAYHNTAEMLKVIFQEAHQ